MNHRTILTTFVLILTVSVPVTFSGSDSDELKTLVMKAYRNERLGYFNTARDQIDRILKIDPDNTYAHHALERFRHREEKKAGLGWYELRLDSLKDNLSLLEQRRQDLQNALDDREKRIKLLEENARDARTRGNFSNTLRNRYLWHRKSDHLQAQANTLKRERHDINRHQIDVIASITRIQNEITSVEKEQMAAWMRTPEIKMPPPPYPDISTGSDVSQTAPIRYVDGVYRNY